MLLVDVLLISSLCFMLSYCNGEHVYVHVFRLLVFNTIKILHNEEIMQFPMTFPFFAIPNDAIVVLVVVVMAIFILLFFFIFFWCAVDTSLLSSPIVVSFSCFCLLLLFLSLHEYY